MTVFLFFTFLHHMCFRALTIVFVLFINVMLSEGCILLLS